MKPVFSKNIPKPIGPYSPAVKANGFLFISGQVGIDVHGTVKGTVEEQTKQTLENIKAILAEENLSLENVVKVTVYLKNMEDFEKMNSVYKTYLKTPARMTCGGLSFSKNFKVEIEAIASYE